MDITQSKTKLGAAKLCTNWRSHATNS